MRFLFTRVIYFYRIIPITLLMSKWKHEETQRVIHLKEEQKQLSRFFQFRYRLFRCNTLYEALNTCLV